MNLTISNVPGPRERGDIEGATVSEIYSVGPVVSGSGMNITVWSYVDQLAISVLTDDRTLDDPHEATDAMLDAFIEIRRAAGITADSDACRRGDALGRCGYLIQPRRRSHQSRPTKKRIATANTIRKMSSTWPTWLPRIMASRNRRPAGRRCG